MAADTCHAESVCTRVRASVASLPNDDECGKYASLEAFISADFSLREEEESLSAVALFSLSAMLLDTRVLRMEREKRGAGETDNGRTGDDGNRAYGKRSCVYDARCDVL